MAGLRADGADAVRGTYAGNSDREYSGERNNACRHRCDIVTCPAHAPHSARESPNRETATTWLHPVLASRHRPGHDKSTCPATEIKRGRQEQLWPVALSPLSKQIIVSID